MESFTPWIEKYRPKKLNEVIGHEEITKRLEALVKTKNIPHLLLVGPPGCGKTTSILAMAYELYGDSFQECFLELNASDERGIDVVRKKMKDFARTVSLANTSFKIIFLDEADNLTSDAQQALRRTMEKYASNTRFILSANYSSRIIEPIQSRCAVFRFSKLSENEIKEIVKKISKEEKLSMDEEAVKAVEYISEGDARKAINCLQGAAALSEKITEKEIYKISSRAKPKEVSEMIETAMKGKFTTARNLLDKLMIEYGMNGEDVIDQIYKEVIQLNLTDEKKVKIIDKIGEYDFRMIEGAQERIQLEALLAQLSIL
ncbi:MAG: replication factor C small subunit [Candidatus Marsarchaeota archaeon]|nr:replication factor C small subunit [Candidatus Marsarchaeota archaeon]